MNVRRIRSTGTRSPLTRQKRNAEREMSNILNDIYNVNRKLEEREQEIFNGFRSGRPYVNVPQKKPSPQRWIP